MALYLGNSEKLKITLDNIAHCLNLCLTVPVINTVKLMSADEYILKDSNGLYLTVKEDK